jgi:hypothetical protein
MWKLIFQKKLRMNNQVSDTGYGEHLVYVHM